MRPLSVSAPRRISPSGPPLRPARLLVSLVAAWGTLLCAPGGVLAEEQAWRQVAVLRVPAVRFAALSPDGERIATSGSEGIGIWDTADGKLVSKFDGPRRGCWLIYSADGSRLMAADWPTTVWDARDGRWIATLRDRRGDVNAAISADGRHVITQSGFHTAVLWDVETGNPVKQLDWGLFPGNTKTIVLPEKWIVTRGGADQKNWFLQIFDLQTMRGLGVLEGADGTGMFSLEGFSADGKWLISDWHEHNHQNFARVWDTQTGKVLRQLGPLKHSVQWAYISPDRSRVYAVIPDDHGDSPTQVWRADTWEPLADRKFETSKAISISHDGQHVAATGKDPDRTQHVEIWDAELTKRLAKLRHGSFISSVAFLPGRDRLVSVGEEKGDLGQPINTVRIWERRGP
jgi:WD40 repeat protein